MRKARQGLVPEDESGTVSSDLSPRIPMLLTGEMGPTGATRSASGVAGFGRTRFGFTREPAAEASV